MENTRKYVIVPFDKYQRLVKAPTSTTQAKKQSGSGIIRKNKKTVPLQEKRPRLDKREEVNRSRNSAPHPGLPDRTKKSRALNKPYNKQNGRGDWKSLWKKVK